MAANRNLQCVQCGRRVDKDKVFNIDGKDICAGCIFAGNRPFQIYPIGFVSNDLQRDNSNFGLRGEGKVSKIELLPSQKQFMYRLEDEEFLTIVYYLHGSRPIKSTFNRGLDGKHVGVFASRTPDRLTRIGIQDVKLIGIDGTNLYVEGLDAINGTPVLDIKMGWHKKN